MTKSRHTSRYRRLLKALREVRLKAGVTQVEVARHFGAHASFVSKIESGERRIDVVELADLCHIYGIRLTVFLKQAGLD
jgi:transcriptional regulator with XRE-family HTH domain